MFVHDGRCKYHLLAHEQQLYIIYYKRFTQLHNQRFEANIGDQKYLK